MIFSKFDDVFTKSNGRHFWSIEYENVAWHHAKSAVSIHQLMYTIFFTSNAFSSKIWNDFTIYIFFIFSGSCGNPDAKRLYDDLLSNYNKLVRPVVNVTDAVTVRLKLKLSQLIDVVSDFWHFSKQIRPFSTISGNFLPVLSSDLSTSCHTWSMS